MPVAPEALMRVHLSAFNAGDPESLVPHYGVRSRVIRDGRLEGEGQEAIQNILRQETASGDVLGQMVDIGGQPAILEWSGPEGHRKPTGIVRVTMVGDRVEELHIDHRESALRRLLSV